MRELVLLACALVVVAGCAGPASESSGSDAAPITSTASESTASTPSSSPGTRVVAIEGNLTFHQTAAITCPYYVESPSQASADELPLAGAIALDLLFEWNYTAAPFRAAILSIVHSGTNVGPPSESVRGPSPLGWHLPADRLEKYSEGDALLKIAGPSCTDGSEPAQSGVDYTQVIHYSGNITYPA